MTDVSLKWAWTMAWRDSRRSRRRLLLFISSIILGVAALVSITSFEEQSQAAVSSQAKTLLGADLSVSMRESVPDEVQGVLDSLRADKTRMIRFPSMVTFVKGGETRLTEIRAMESGYPFYGSIETDPPSASSDFPRSGSALVEEWLALQYNASPGDSIQVGTLRYRIGGYLKNMPGEISVGGLVSPRVLLPYSNLDAENLLGPGSLASYTTYFNFENPDQVTRATDRLDELRANYRVSYDTIEERRSEWGEATGNLYSFLNLVGFIALLLGAVGIASTIHVYIRQKISTVALLRCLGASSKQTVRIFAIQAFVLGVAGSIAGVLLGLAIQGLLPVVLSDFLPVEVGFGISVKAIIEGVLVGTGVTMLFAMWPLLELRHVSPLKAIRTEYEDPDVSGRTLLRVALGLLMLSSILLFAVYQTGSWIVGASFTTGITVALLVLGATSSVLIKLVRKYFPHNAPFVLRQGLANLYRPNNQTLVLVLAIGLGTFLISTLYLTRTTLLDQVSFSGSGDRPNVILFDIQPDQVEGVRDEIETQGLPLIQSVPIVTMRIESINGETPSELLADSTREFSRFALQREYRTTYRNELSDTETILEGVFSPGSTDGEVSVSLEEDIAADLKVAVGDPIVWDVQGVPIASTVGSIRRVDWQRVQPNFFVVFPEGVLEDAPQFHVAVTRVDSDSLSAALQRSVVSKYPNVSIIDLSLILETVDTYLGKISFVIQFMALFSILTGLIVLASAVLASRFQRIRESVLLRTLGASRKQVLRIMMVEYSLLGVFAALVGLGLSLVAGWLLATFVFDVPFNPFRIPIILVAFSVVALTLLIGLLGSRGIHGKPPLAILRAEN